MDQPDECSEFSEKNTTGNINRVLKNLQNIPANIANKEPTAVIEKTTDDFGFVEMDDVSRLMTELKLFKRDIQMRALSEEILNQSNCESTTWLSSDKQLEDEVAEFKLNYRSENCDESIDNKEKFVLPDVIRQFFSVGIHRQF